MVTVIIPVYNVEKYIEKCLNSVMNQTYRDLEILVIDDGSTDQSGIICDTIAQKDGRIRVIHQRNGGLSAARNAGLDHATGEFVMFIDGDDYIHSKMAETLLRSIREYDADIAVGKYAYVEENEDIDIYSELVENEKLRKINGKCCCKELYGDNPTETIIMCNKMFRIELFANVRFPLGKLHEDEFVIYKLLYNSSWVVYTGVVLYYYLQRSNSIMLNQNYGEGHLSILEMQEGAITFFMDHGEEELVHTAVLRAFGLGRMLYYKYDMAKRKDLQKNVLKQYRTLTKKYINSAGEDWSSKIILVSFGYSPRLFTALTQFKGWLWKKKHQK